MTYNCETKEIVIPLIEEPSVDVTTLYVTDTCCGEPKSYTYCNPENQINLLDVSLTIENLQQVKEEPEFDCYIEMTWDEYISLDATNVTSLTGTKYTYISGSLTDTETIDVSYFNTTHSVFTTAPQADRQYIYLFNATLINGITIYYEVSYNTNVDYFSDEICSIVDFSDSLRYEYTCQNEVVLGEGTINFNLDLSDGFYSISWEDINGCLIVECDKSLECIVKEKIEETFKDCYSCNKKKDLEYNMTLLMYYKAFISDCLDCCEKCNLYYKIKNDCRDC